MTQSYWTVWLNVDFSTCVTDIYGHILNKQGGHIDQPDENVGFTPRGRNNILFSFMAESSPMWRPIRGRTERVWKTKPEYLRKLSEITKR
jgi:hypothetical protein